MFFRPPKKAAKTLKKGPTLEDHFSNWAPSQTAKAAHSEFWRRAKGPELEGHPVCLIVLQSSSCVNYVISQLITNVGESLGHCRSDLRLWLTEFSRERNRLQHACKGNLVSHTLWRNATRPSCDGATMEQQGVAERDIRTMLQYVGFSLPRSQLLAITEASEPPPQRIRWWSAESVQAKAGDAPVPPTLAATRV